MKIDHWIQEYKINSFLVNWQGRMGLYAILNCLQDAAWLHADKAGLGYEQFKAAKMFWVLTRQTLQMNHWPVWGEEIRVKTWLRPPENTAVLRDFFIYDSKGNMIGSASTSWLALSTETRKPTKVDTTGFLADLFLSDSSNLPTEKIALPENFDRLSSLAVRNSDLDLNNHVNNTRYAQWVLDSVPRSDHTDFMLHEYQVNFLAETHLGDLVHIERERIASEPQAKQWVHFRGVRESDQKTVFSCKVLISRKLN